MTDENIIIVGAGASGLMAARELAKAGKRVTVLEAKETTGGRILDVPAKNGFSPFMLGAEFIHGNAEVTFSLLKDAGIEYTQVSGKNYNAKQGKLTEFDSDKDFWLELSEKLEELKEDTSLFNFLQLHFGDEKYAAFRESVLRFAEGFDAADPNRVSIFSLKREWEHDDDEHFRIKGGYSELIKYLEQDCIAHGVLILTSKIVSHFNWSRGYVEAICSDGQRFVGKKAVITLPLGVLQVKDGSLGSVTLSPPLPIRMGAVRAMGFGAVIKVVLKFKQAFWPADAGFIFGNQAIPVWWTQNPDETSVLTGWLAGPSVQQYKGSNEENLIHLALQCLTEVFGYTEDELTDDLVEAHAANWLDHPFSRGAYTYITVEEPNAGVILSNPVQETLYFAGEATFTGVQVGTVEAALVSGKEAAQKILDV